NGKTSLLGVFLHIYNMKEIVLELLFTLTVGAASGIHKDGNHVYIVSDNSGYIYHYGIDSKQVDKWALYENAQEITPKKEKKDFESVTAKDGKHYVLGSGSKAKRQTCYVFDPRTNESEPVSLAPLYYKLSMIGEVGKDLNIEGVIHHKNEFLLFQRGNGASARNGIFRIKADDLASATDITFTEVKLPKIDKGQAAFTDAVLVKDKIYFLAAAEGTKSTYDDGVI